LAFSKDKKLKAPKKKFLKDGESVLLDDKGKEKTKNVLKKYSVFNLEQTKSLEKEEVKETFNIMSIDTLK